MIKLTAALGVSLFAGILVAKAGEKALPGAGVKHVEADLYHFNPWPEVGDRVADARARLVSTEQGITAIVETSDLPLGKAVTVWWILFNNPKACTNHPEPCTDEDLFEVAETKGDVSWAAGAVVGEDGRAVLAGHHPAGNNAHEMLGNGLINPLGAEVRLELRTHGPAIDGQVENMITAFNGGCDLSQEFPEDMLAMLPEHFLEPGVPGSNKCAQLQKVVLQQH